METHKKASLDKLYDLHARVAETLMENLDDPKVLTAAIKFLKDNGIEADLMDSAENNNVAVAIKEHIQLTASRETKLSVDDMKDMLLAW